MHTIVRRAVMTLATGGVVLGGGAAVAGSAQAADTGIPVLEAIKQCESGGSYTAVNASSGASGAYQFLDSTWQGLSASQGYSTAASAPASVQDAAAIELYNQAGTTPWAASQSCWSGASGATTSSSSTSSTSTAATTTSTTSSSTSGTSTPATSSTGSSSTSAAPQQRADGTRPAVGTDRQGAERQGAERQGARHDGDRGQRGHAQGARPAAGAGSAACR